MAMFGLLFGIAYGIAKHCTGGMSEAEKQAVYDVAFQKIVNNYQETS